ncbi:GyrI-like domain-containing protein [Nocardia paucivorans]|uniref:GyrI-like domain-containing protein n=1 Tax=Nocardia paucivorans TaxID=114259 RepID=UPI00059245F8|nr:GyrI-like domain-containing protein [Nocardia paucivorans]
MTNRTDHTTAKIDFKREMAVYRARHGQIQLVDVPDLQYLMIDGHGDPNTDPSFAEAAGALYPLAYKLKFTSKQDLGRDYVVMPLEGLWWSDDMDTFTSARDKSRWDWTLMIMVPYWIDQDMFTDAVARVAAKNRPRRLHEVRLDSLSEGRCAQTLHIGSYDDEAEVLARMHHEFIPGHGLRMVGRHHEIYLNDFRKVAPDKLRTILRQPVAEADS